MTLIMAFSGRARHGKTECCEAILEAIHFDVSAHIYDIGDMIRQYCIQTGRLPQVERKDMSREQLQVMIDVGKEKRAGWADYWIGKMTDQIVEDDLEVALIPNLRYWNEAEAIHSMHGAVIRVTRLNYDGSVYMSPDRDPNDVSETSLEFWPADFYLTQKQGHNILLQRQAVQLYDYLRCGYGIVRSSS